MPFSNYLANKILTDHVVSGGSVFLQLHVNNPTATCTEGVIPQQVRIDVTAKFNPAVSGGTSNLEQILSDEFTTTAVVSHVSLWDHATVGNPLYYGPTTASRTVGPGDIWRAAEGALTITNLTA